ncbi:hypothetical protein ACHAXT_002804 [Thalassiosira profunda]
MDEQRSLLNGNGAAGRGYGGAPSSPPDDDSLPFLTPPQSAAGASSPVPTIDTSIARQRRSSIAAIAAAREIHRDQSARKIHRETSKRRIPMPLINVPSMDSDEADEEVQKRMDSARRKKDKRHMSVSKSSSARLKENNLLRLMHQIASQLPAIAIASVLNFMIGIPFGASYFPTELELDGKEVLGLRMYLFATMVAQLVFTFKSKFVNGIGLQMVENVPFCLELARVVIEVQGNGTGAISTLFFIFGLSSVIVGLVFYLLGRLELGKIVYYFPSHVLVGCIGGIGAFIAKTSLEVTTNTTFSFTAEGFNETIVQHFHLLAPVIGFEVVLRLLMRLTEKNGEPRYPLLGPIYYCFITPVFYAMMWVFGISMDRAMEAGYFFPPLSSSGSMFSAVLFDIFTEIHPSMISWKAVGKAIPTMVSLTAFSLIHVPINIPAFGVSTNVEPDMNAELIAHGYSNAISGLFGGLQNYMAYSNSVIYSKSGGKGQWSSIAIAAVTVAIFGCGPTIAAYVPRCMAGTLLLHVGVDLFLEGVAESYEDYDRLEYSGIWLITIVMLLFGMDAALIAGVIAALSTFVAQSVVYQDPIRGSMTGARLRSSAWNRSEEAQRILLDSETGRQRIFIIQLQGHIFFGNVTKMADDIKRFLYEKHAAVNEPLVVILDFTHVLGVDSSAAQSIAKLKPFLVKTFDIEIMIFVTGHEDGFRCTYNLSNKVLDTSQHDHRSSIKIVEHRHSVQDHRMSVTARALELAHKDESAANLIAQVPNSRVCPTLDAALIFAEDVLIALEDPSILQTDSSASFPYIRSTSENLDAVKSVLETLLPDATASDIDTLYALLVPERYQSGDTVWQQGDASESLKFVIEGDLLSLLEDEHGATESVCSGSTIGELGLVSGIPRLTTVKVLNEALLYSLSKEKWDVLTQRNPGVARHVDLLLVRYLAHRVQHVSSHSLLDATRSLPV